MQLKILITSADKGFVLASNNNIDNMGPNLEIYDVLSELLKRVEELILKDLDQKSKG